MPLLVDTYNVLHVTGVLPPDLAGIEPWDLARLIAQSRYRHDDALLVCDGVPKPDAPPGRDGLVRIRYAGPGVSADDVIIRRVDADTAPRRLTVVSSDQAIIRAARKRRCRTVASDVFLRQLADDADLPRENRTPGDAASQPTGRVDAWNAFFNIDEGQLSELLEPEMPAHLADSLRETNSASPPKTHRSDDGPPDAPSAGTVPAPPDPSTYAGLFPADLLDEAADLDNDADHLPPILPPAAKAALADDDEEADEEPLPDIDLDRIDELDMEAILRRRPPEPPLPPTLGNS